MSMEDIIAKAKAAAANKKGRASLAQKRPSRVSRRMSRVTAMKNVSKTSAVVVDIGESFCKIGFAGDAKPRFILPSVFTDGTTTVSHVFSRGHHNITSLQWERMMLVFLKKIYFDCLQVSVKDLSVKDRKLFICENPFLPYKLRQGLAKAAVVDMEVPGIAFLSSSQLPIFASGLTPAKLHGVVVDVGYGETRVLPVHHGHAVREARVDKALGMREVFDYFREIISPPEEKKTDSDAGPSSASSSATPSPLVSKLTDDVVGDIVARMCYLRPMPPSAVVDDKGDIKEPDAKDPTPLPTDVPYQIDNTTRFTVSGKARSRCADALFGANGERWSVAACILESLLKSNFDVRSASGPRLLLAGGGCMLPGFQHRLIDELNNLLNLPLYAPLKALQNKFSFIQTDFPPNILSWVGGSLLGALEYPSEFFLTGDNLRTAEDDKIVVTTNAQKKLIVPMPIQSVVEDWLVPNPPTPLSDDEEDDTRTF